MSTTLAAISKAKTMLARATSMDDILNIRDQAEAFRAYAKAAGKGFEAMNAAAEIKLMAERKAGAVLAGMELDKGAATERGNSMLPRLDDLGISKMQSSRWQREAEIPEDVFAAHVARCNDDGIELTQAGVLALVKAAHVSHASGENEWYTPPEFIQIARVTMGAIDLDPASSELAQQTVNAKTFYTLADDGLSQHWTGRVWMNPPYSKEACARFAVKLLEHVTAKDVAQACVLVNNATETAWMQSMLRACAAVCFPAGRIRFHDKTGRPANSPLQGQALLYFGPRIEQFEEACATTGPVLFAR